MVPYILELTTLEPCVTNQTTPVLRHATRDLADQLITLTTTANFTFSLPTAV
jgi:hypothetical protein